MPTGGADVRTILVIDWWCRQWNAHCGGERHVVGSWTQIAWCWHFVLVASDRLSRGRFRVSIVFKDRLNCLCFAIKALNVSVEIENFFVKYGRHTSDKKFNGVDGDR